MPAQDISMGMLCSAQKSDFGFFIRHEDNSDDRLIEDGSEANAEITLRDGIRKVIGYDVVNKRLNQLELERTATKLNVISKLDEARARIKKLEDDKKTQQDEIAELKQIIVKQNAEHEAAVEDLQKQMKIVLAQLALNGTNSSAGDDNTPEPQVYEFVNIKAGQVRRLQDCWEQLAELRGSLVGKERELRSERYHRSSERKERAKLDVLNTQLLKQNNILKKPESDDGCYGVSTDRNQPLEHSEHYDTLGSPTKQFQEEETQHSALSQNEPLAIFFAGLMKRGGSISTTNKDLP